MKMHLNNNSDSIEKLTEFLQLTFPNTHLKVNVKECAGHYVVGSDKYFEYPPAA